MSIAEKLTIIAENQRDVYNAGFTAGQAQGGGDSYYDTFWDAYLNPVGYSALAGLFAGYGWDDITFCPPVGTVISAVNRGGKSATMMFIYSRITDLKAICDKLDVKIDLSKATGFSQLLTDSQITTFPTIDTTSASNLNNIFMNAVKLQTVEKVILKEDGSQTFNSSSFSNCTALQNIVFEGVIGKSITFAGSPELSSASVQSIVDHLKELTVQTTQTLTVHQEVRNRMTEEQVNTVVNVKKWTLAPAASTN